MRPFRWKGIWMMWSIAAGCGVLGKFRAHTFCNSFLATLCLTKALGSTSDNIQTAQLYHHDNFIYIYLFLTHSICMFLFFGGVFAFEADSLSLLVVNPFLQNCNFNSKQHISFYLSISVSPTYLCSSCCGQHAEGCRKGSREVNSISHTLHLKTKQKSTVLLPENIQ